MAPYALPEGLPLACPLRLLRSRQKACCHEHAAATLLVKVEAAPPRKRMLGCMKMPFGKAERDRAAPVVLCVEHGALPATPPPEFYSGKGRGRSSKRQEEQEEGQLVSYFWMSANG